MLCTWLLLYIDMQFSILLWEKVVRGSVVGLGTLLQAGRSPVRVPDEVDFSNLPNNSSRTMASG
jgi:hypothetical protein